MAYSRALVLCAVIVAAVAQPGIDRILGRDIPGCQGALRCQGGAGIGPGFADGRRGGWDGNLGQRGVMATPGGMGGPGRRMPGFLDSFSRGRVPFGRGQIVEPGMLHYASRRPINKPNMPKKPITQPKKPVYPKQPIIQQKPLFPQKEPIYRVKPVALATEPIFPPSNPNKRKKPSLPRKEPIKSNKPIIMRRKPILPPKKPIYQMKPASMRRKPISPPIYTKKKTIKRRAARFPPKKRFSKKKKPIIPPKKTFPNKIKQIITPKKLKKPGHRRPRRHLIGRFGSESYVPIHRRSRVNANSEVPDVTLP